LCDINVRNIQKHATDLNTIDYVRDNCLSDNLFLSKWEVNLQCDQFDYTDLLY